MAFRSFARIEKIRVLFPRCLHRLRFQFINRDQPHVETNLSFCQHETSLPTFRMWNAWCATRLDKPSSIDDRCLMRIDRGRVNL